MSITLRDHLRFPFNDGRGIRTDQLDGAVVESYTFLENGKLRLTSRNSQNVQSSADIPFPDNAAASRTGWVPTRIITPRQIGTSGDVFQDCAVDANDAYLLATQGESGYVAKLTDAGVVSIIPLLYGTYYRALGVRDTHAIIAQTNTDESVWSVSSYLLTDGSLVSTLNSFATQRVRVLAAHWSEATKLLEIREGGSGSFELRILTIASDGGLSHDAGQFALTGLHDPISGTIRGDYFLVMESSGDVVAYAIAGFARAMDQDEVYHGIAFSGFATHSDTVEYISTEGAFYRFEESHIRWTDDEDTPDTIIAGQAVYGNAAGDALEFLPEREIVKGVKRATIIPTVFDETLLYLTHDVIVHTDAEDLTLIPGFVNEPGGVFYGWSRGGVFTATGSLSEDDIPLEYIGSVNGSTEISGAHRVVETYDIEFVGSLNEDFGEHWPKIVVNDVEYDLSNPVYYAGTWLFTIADGPTGMTAAADVNFKNSDGKYLHGTNLLVESQAGIWKWDGSEYILVTPDPLTVDDIIGDSDQYGFLAPDVFREGVRHDTEQDFRTIPLLGDASGLPSKWNSDFIRHVSWYLHERTESLLAVVGGGVQVLSRAADGNVRIRTDASSYTELVGADFDPSGAAYSSGGHVILLKDRGLAAWEYAHKRKLTIDNTDASTYELALPAQGGEWLDIDIADDKFWALRRLTDGSLHVLRGDLAEVSIEDHVGRHQLGRAEITTATSGKVMFDADDATVGTAAAGADLSVYSDPTSSAELEIGSFNVQAPYWNMIGGERPTVYMDITGATLGSYLLNDTGSVAARQGSFYGHNELVSGLKIGQFRIINQLNSVDQITIIINSTIDSTVEFTDWDHGDNKSFYIVDASNTILEVPISHIENNFSGLIGGGFIRFDHFLSTDIRAQSAGSRIYLIFGNSGGLQQSVRYSIERKNANTVAWTDWPESDRNPRSLYYVIDSVVEEFPFEDARNTEAEYVEWVRSGTSPAQQPAGGSTIYIIVSDKDVGVTGNAANETRVTSPTLLSVPGTLPGGRPVAMSAQSQLSLLFSGGMVALWDIGDSALTRNSSDDFDTNVFVKPGTPASLHHGISDLIVHVGNYLRSFSNTSQAQDNAVAAVGDDLVSYTLYRQAATEPSTPSIHWRWNDGWSEEPHPWSLSRAQAILNHSLDAGASDDDPVWIYTGTSQREYDASTGGYNYTDSIPDLLQEWDLQYTPDPYAHPVVIRSAHQTGDWWRSRGGDGTYGPWTPTGPVDWLPIKDGFAYRTDGGLGQASTFNIPASRQDWGKFKEIRFAVYSFGEWSNGSPAYASPLHHFILYRPADGWNIQDVLQFYDAGHTDGEHYLVFHIHYGLSIGHMYPPHVQSANSVNFNLLGTTIEGEGAQPVLETSLLFQWVRPTGVTGQNVGKMVIYRRPVAWVRLWISMEGR